MGDDLEIKIRQAHIGDVQGLLDLHYRCFEPDQHLAMLFGKSFMRSVYRWFVTSGKNIVVVAEVPSKDGKIVGVCTATDGPYHRLMLSHNKLSLIRSFLLRPWLVLKPAIRKRLKETLFTRDSVEQELEQDEKVVHGGLVGVDPEYRRRGLAVRVLQETYRECHRRGYTKMIGITYKENVAVRRALVKVGYKELSFPGDKKSLFTVDFDE
jgi:ribosomal protein S18 acetylase RimI-like enzyme